MSATISNAYRRSLRVKILAKAQAKVEAKAKATITARAGQKDMDKGKTRVRVDKEEALTASQTRTTGTRTRTEATRTLIQGGFPSPLEGSLVRPHAQAQQAQGAKREHEGGDDGNAKKRSRFMRMARKLRNKGVKVTCPAEF